jgi:hypothetical protein
MWWIGVKEDGKMRSFEATLVEAFSPEFESKFGCAFGSYRSKIQAESDIKMHTVYLRQEANKERLKRLELAQTAQKEVKSGTIVQKHTKKLSELSQQAMKTSKPTELGIVLERLQVSKLVLEALNDLKLSIVRAIEAVKVLKDQLEEQNDKH